MFGVYSQQGGASITLNEIIITSDASGVHTSLDGGATWITNVVGTAAARDRLIWGNNEFVYTRSDIVYTSPDGITWTNTGVTLTGINKFIYANGYYFVSRLGASPNPCHIQARESFNSGSWTTVHTTPAVGQYIYTLTYYDGRVYFIQETATTPTFHSILISDLSVTNYGTMNSSIVAGSLRDLYRVHNGWVASPASTGRVAYTTSNTGWSVSNQYYIPTSILVTDTDNLDYVAIFATNTAGTTANGLRFDATGSKGTNSMRSTMANVFSDGTYFYCWSTTATTGVYRRLVTNWSATWTRDANATTAGITSSFNILMATGGTPNNVYIWRNDNTLYKTVSGSGIYTFLGSPGTLKFVGRV